MFIRDRDNAAVRIHAFAQYKVIDIELALLNNKEYDEQLYVNLQLALREFVGGFSFDELLEKKDVIAQTVNNSIQEKAFALGCLLYTSIQYLLANRFFQNQ